MIKIYLDECCYGCSKALLDMNYEDSAMRYANGDHVGGRDYSIVCKKIRCLYDPKDRKERGGNG